MTSFHNALFGNMPQQGYMVPMFGRQAKGFGQQQMQQPNPLEGMPGTLPMAGYSQSGLAENNPFYLEWLRQFQGR